MLKTVLLSLAFVVGVLSAPQDGYRDSQAALMMEFKDFITALPIQKMYDTLVSHLNDDLEMQAALKHVQGKEFQQSCRALMTKPSVKELIMKYKDAGFDIERYQRMGSNIIAGLSISVPDGTDRSFGKFLDDINKLIPYEKLMGILADKLENRPVFIKFFNYITSEDMHTLVDKTLHSAEFKYLAQELQDMDVAIYQIVDALYSIFGWKNKQTSANDL